MMVTRSAKLFFLARFKWHGKTSPQGRGKPPISCRTNAVPTHVLDCMVTLCTAGNQSGCVAVVEMVKKNRGTVLGTPECVKL
mmetsp:Transcript_17890/g.26525  ORF Transcript_17890/g.26525 Transcript_17890/m.26525 type:complete len:82 (-) Transcript_17890:3938-4183(-)